MEVSTPKREREFEFTSGDFERIRRLVKDNCGISLGEHKEELVYGRLLRRIRSAGLKTCKQYLRYLEAHQDEELTELINAITTNVTHFFREAHHFEFLQTTLLPEIWQRNASSRRVRIWSAGCSTGEEAYSIAMTLLEAPASPPGWDTKILATDLDTNALGRAASGIYSLTSLTNLPVEKRKRWFHRGFGSQEGFARVKPDLRKLITFRRLNLLDQWPMQSGFDVVFCRNVVIYFSAETTATLMRRFYDRLVGNGHLFLGHSERIGHESAFEHRGLTVYRKAA